MNEVRPGIRQVRIDAGRVELEGDLGIPDGAGALVVFAHGSGSSRLSPRNRFVARFLRQHGFGTLLFDLLTQEEDETDRWTGELRFDIDLLSARLAAATNWCEKRPELAALSLGYFGASTGAAAALAAAVGRQNVRAVVSRGGRPDLAPSALATVTAPTLLIVGENDPVVLQLNRDALRAIRAEKALKIVAGATHLFEEPGALEQAAELACAWFQRYLR